MISLEAMTAEITRTLIGVIPPLIQKMTKGLEDAEGCMEEQQDI